MYKLKKGTDSLYLGKGLFFYSNKTYSEEDLKEVSEKAKEKYFEEIKLEKEQGKLGFIVDETYTEESLKKMVKAEQEKVLKSLGLNPKEYKNESERIKAILSTIKAGE
ncbi:hypothetical protein [Caloranaerobacter azorensis]|uniref:YqbF C-terminal domain-containing protein n=1 Tax=Caloranaerobacter azorensis TaxID=116090 RepID=A0A6P1YD39_9FIRM|nr:hypothetical protein [Caloranaerobacter azorensis]QIB26095.1 hypothetical protein G3A45_01485 [Caloranaerobacter azorensis]